MGKGSKQRPMDIDKEKFDKNYNAIFGNKKKEKKMNYEYHELANLFPLMDEAQYGDLVADIKENGLIEAIILHEGKILDGRNRYNACNDAGVEPNLVEYEGEDALSYVISLNLNRRHLNESQRAMIGAKLANMQVGDNQHGQPNWSNHISQKDASDKLNVGLNSIKRAKQVQKEGIEDLQKSVEAGKVSVSAASDIAKLTRDQQKIVIKDLDKKLIKERFEEIKKENVLVSKYTGNEEWYTPKKYIDMARNVMGGIDIDPASNNFANLTVNATTYYTKEDDGLSKDWEGKVWLNPPYSSIISEFINKICNSNVEAVVLTNNSTDTKWYQQAAINCNAICFTSGRINFYNTEQKKSSPTNGQSFFYFGNNKEKFNSIFKEIGFVVEVIK